MNNLNSLYLSDAKEEVRSRVDIAQVIGRYVKLKPAGQNLKGSCPFHKEKTPSFIVSPSKAVFHCFGCGKGGDIFTFLMEIEGLTFPEALQRLAEETGVTLRPFKEQAQDTKQARISKTDALKIHEIATHYYYDQMKKSSVAVAYFKSRQLKPEIVKEFRLGYAPEGWSQLIDHAKLKKVSEDKLLTCGLIIPSSQGGAPYDRFRNRIIFPIFDISGKPIAFGGRGMDQNSVPKYLNSPETILYRKNRVLYGLHKARPSIKEKGSVIFVEGYMDFLSLYQAGIRNVVATSGTAFTEEHGHLIRRFTSKIILVFDGDHAGISAAERAVFVLAPRNLDVHVLILPENEDPDSFVKKHGPDSFNEKTDAADDATLFILKRALKQHDSATAKGKSAIVDYILPLLQATTDQIMQSTLVKQVAEHLDIREQLIYAALAKKRQKGHQPRQAKQTNAAEWFVETEEGSFLHLIVKEPLLISLAQKHISTETFTDFYTKNLYSLIVNTYTHEKTLENIIDRTDNEDIKRALSLMLIKEVQTENQQEDVSHKAKRFLLKLNKQRMHEITKKLRATQDPDNKKDLLHRQKLLSMQRGELI